MRTSGAVCFLGRCLLGIGILANLSPAQSIAAEDAWIESAEAVISRGFSYVGPIEQKALEMAGGSARREGDSLILKLSTGYSRTFTDRPECNAVDQTAVRCKAYRLVARASSRGVFIVLTEYYESAEFILVADSGEETEFPGLPRLSATGDHLLLLVNDVQYKGLPIQVWKKGEDGYRLEWSTSPFPSLYSTEYRLLGWRGEERIDLRAQQRNGLEPDSTVPFSVVHDSQGWRVLSK
jgi:hypothetical protein